MTKPHAIEVLGWYDGNYLLLIWRILSKARIQAQELNEDIKGCRLIAQSRQLIYHWIISCWGRRKTEATKWCLLQKEMRKTIRIPAQ